MRFTLTVTYTDIPSKEFIFDAFNLSKDLLSSGFEIRFISEKIDKTIFTIKTNNMKDLYVAGMIGAWIEQKLKEQQQ